MKKHIMSISILLMATLHLIGCSNNEEKPSKVNIKQLTRVDVQTVESDVMITDKATVDLLGLIFEQTEWEQNVKAEMARKEDVKVTLFFSFDENMPERLVEYFIWFNQGNETATIIDWDEHAYGTLEKENATKLKEILLKK